MGRGCVPDHRLCIKAFALYYGMQAAIAALTAAKSTHHRNARWLFGLLALFGLAIAILGRAVEGG